MFEILWKSGFLTTLEQNHKILRLIGEFLSYFQNQIKTLSDSNSQTRDESQTLQGTCTMCQDMYNGLFQDVSDR